MLEILKNESTKLQEIDKFLYCFTTFKGYSF